MLWVIGDMDGDGLPEVAFMTHYRILVYDGQTVHVPLPAGQGTGLGRPLKIINHPVRADIPIWWASLMGLSVAALPRVRNL